MAVFHEKFRSLRIASGATQRELAAKLDVTEGTLNRWERGHQRPSVEQLLGIADHFGVTLDELARGEASDEHAAAQ